jgi:two-component system, LytTR family, sensor kinase
MRSRLRYWALGGAFFTAAGLLHVCYKVLDFLSRSRSIPFVVPFVEEMTAAYGAGVLLLGPVIGLSRRIRAGGRPWPLQAVQHLGLLLAFSAAHTTWNYVTRQMAFTVLGLGHYDYGIMAYRYPMELPVDVIVYGTFVAIVYLFDHYVAARDRELQVAQLETELTRLRLETLEGQLRPHFLFNALNTVSAVMYEDVAAADTMLTRLGDLLRHTLRRPAGGEVSLGEELETLDLYLEIMRARFADRLTVEVSADQGARRAAVPPLLLQPLVENALRHGDPGPGVRAVVGVKAWRVDGRLMLEVSDNGPGIPAAPPGGRPGSGQGIGFDNTARRLAQLYGTDHLFRWGNREGGGLMVSVGIPFREVR